MKYTYLLENLGCASCAAKMEVAINKIDGVESARITFMTARLTIETDESMIGSIEQQAEKAVRKIESKVRLKRV
ncbi:MAG: cation transporter [Candidatus Methanoplasma sp.]|jgi:cation transport ATPase|nr:cation transporter [Candidatus Methanoplasma sp.]